MGPELVVAIQPNGRLSTKFIQAIESTCHLSTNSNCSDMTPHYARGKNDAIAFVFSCPGRLERDCGHPAAGTTGRNLEQLLRLIATRRSDQSPTRADITIANAWHKVEFEGETRRTEASDAEVLSGQNIARLARELEHVTGLIVFCGKKAQLAAGLLHQNELLLPKNPAFAYLPHLGGQSLNRIARDAQGTRILSAKQQKNMGVTEALDEIGKENTRRRLDALAVSLVADFNTALNMGG